MIYLAPSGLVHKVWIGETKQQALEEYTQLTDAIQIYSDGLGHEGKIRATATPFRTGQCPRTLHYHLRTDEEHAVFREDTVGLNVAADLLATEVGPTFKAS
jgi:hypothetical protein